jgi:hypothetical protein
MLTNKEVNQQITELEKQLVNVKGTPCEVWSRVCGFFRPVSAYNPGKREEFYERLPYNVSNLKVSKVSRGPDDDDDRDDIDYGRP